jgi:hypothetical protein
MVKPLSAGYTLFFCAQAKHAVIITQDFRVANEKYYIAIPKFSIRNALALGTGILLKSVEKDYP